MKTQEFDVVIVGAGPVGLMCAYLGQLCGLRTAIIDKTLGPLEVGRADALNARTLQLLEIASLFDEVYPFGKTCDTSSVWSGGKFLSRQSSWWKEIEGCFHKHFLMLGQSHVEKLLDRKLQDANAGVRRGTSVVDVDMKENGCVTRLSTGETLQSKYVVGADGPRSFIRDHFKVAFEITRPQMVWAVIDGIIETDFNKVPEIIVFQTDTSDVAWIPREGDLDRFYVRMDTKDFKIEGAVAKINRAMHPHTLRFKEIQWFSQFSVKESVAEKFALHDCVFLVGDACHIHSVNGGQGLNTGLGDAFNLMWKLKMVIQHGACSELLSTYESERKPVALSVIESSGELVRSTKFSDEGTHAEDYVRIIQKRAGNITGMGIRYGSDGLRGTRVFDQRVFNGSQEIRLYSLLRYSCYTLLIFGRVDVELKTPTFVKVIEILTQEREASYWTPDIRNHGRAILVRPDSYIEGSAPIDEVELLLRNLKISCPF